MMGGLFASFSWRKTGWFALVGLFPVAILIAIWHTIVAFRMDNAALLAWEQQERLLAPLSQEPAENLPTLLEKKNQDVPHSYIALLDCRNPSEAPPGITPPAQGITSPRVLPSHPVFDEILRQGFLAGRRELQQKIICTPYFLSWMPVCHGRFLVTATHFKPPAPLPIIILLHALGFGWLVLVFRRPDLLEWGFRANLSGNLAIAFSLSVGLPSLLLVVAGTVAIKERVEGIVRKVVKAGMDRLQIVDAMSREEYGRIDDLFSQALQRAEKCPTGAEGLPVIQSLASEALIQRLVVLRENGEPVYEYSKDLQGNKISQDNLAQWAKSFFSKAPGTEGKTHGQFRHLELHRLSLCFRQDLLGPWPTGERLFVHAELDSRALEEGFGRRCQMEFVPLAIEPTEIHFGSTQAGKPGVLSDPLREAVVASMCRELRLREAMVIRRYPTSREDAIWVGLPGRHLRHFFPLARLDMDPINGRVGAMFLLLLATVVLLFVGSFLLGKSLTRRFLNPLGDVTEGVQAIARRDFAFRVPDAGEDELGKLGSLMNRVIEDMNDLQVAAFVQEHLFPQKRLQIESFAIFGRSRPMIDIGGDYFDYFPIGESRLIGLIGDVAGHGVSAALIMGMAKGAFAIDPNQKIESFLERFNLLLGNTLKFRRMMTLFIFNLNVATGDLTFANAGHNFPLHFSRRTRIVRYLECPSLPLGVMKKLSYQVQTLHLEPEDAILFYTDGFVEAMDTRGSQIGYPRLSGWFAEFADRPVEEIADRLFHLFSEETRTTAPSDDVTLMCLKEIGGLIPAKAHGFRAAS